MSKVKILKIMMVEMTTLVTKAWAVPEGARVVTVLPSGQAACLDVVVEYEIEVQDKEPG